MYVVCLYHILEFLNFDIQLSYSVKIWEEAANFGLRLTLTLGFYWSKSLIWKQGFNSGHTQYFKVTAGWCLMSKLLTPTAAGVRRCGCGAGSRGSARWSCWTTGTASPAASPAPPGGDRRQRTRRRNDFLIQTEILILHVTIIYSVKLTLGICLERTATMLTTTNF